MMGQDGGLGERVRDMPAETLWFELFSRGSSMLSYPLGQMWDRRGRERGTA